MVNLFELYDEARTCQRQIKKKVLEHTLQGGRLSHSVSGSRKQFREATSGVFDTPHLCAVNFVLRLFRIMPNPSPVIFIYFISYKQGSEQTNKQTNISYQILTI